MNENVPESTNIWQFCVIFPKCKIKEFNKESPYFPLYRA